MRYFTAFCVLFASLAFSGPVFAIDTNLPKQTAEQLKSVCDKAGGEFSQDAHGYGCGTDCKGKPGTACTVFCETDKKCVAQVIRGRRPRSIEAALAPETKHGH